MKNIIEIESAEELVNMASRVRPPVTKAPYIDPTHVTLVIDGGVPRLQDKQGQFQLSSDITESDIYEAMAKKCNIALYLRPEAVQKIEEWAIAGLLADGGRRKQYCLEQILIALGLDLGELRIKLLEDGYDWEPGIAP